MSFADIKEYNQSIETEKSWPGYVVFSATFIFAIVAVLSPCAAISTYIYQSANAAVDTCQVILIVASTVSLIFVGLYFLAARRNEDVGTVRPPARPWHNACFVSLRIALIIWLVSVTASFVTAFKTICPRAEDGYLCRLQIVEGGLSAGAFVLGVIILTLLERCSKPFATPKVLRIRPKLRFRISAWGDDIFLERSVSRGASFEEKRPSMIQIHSQKSTISLASKPGVARSATQTEYETLRAPVLPKKPSSHGAGWGSAWLHLAAEAGCNSDFSTLAPSKSLSDTSSSVSSNSSVLSPTKRPRRMGSNSSISSAGESWDSQSTACSSDSGKSRKAAPSSSISDSSHRSPLSFMRTVSQPEVAFQPELRIIPLPGAQSSPDSSRLRHSRRRSVHRPRAAQPRDVQRMTSMQSLPQSVYRPRPSSRRSLSMPPRLSSRSTYTAYTPDLQSAEYVPPVPPMPRMESPAARSQIHDKYSSSYNMEDALEQHTQKIEDAIFAHAVQIEMTRQLIPKPLQVNTSRRLPPVPQLQVSAPEVFVPHARPRSRSTINCVDGSDDEEEDEENHIFKRIVSEKSPRISMRLSSTKLAVNDLWGI